MALGLELKASESFDVRQAAVRSARAVTSWPYRQECVRVCAS